MIRKRLVLLFVLLLTPLFLNAQRSTNTLVLHADAIKDTISKYVYRQFAEHLGHGIYGGIIRPFGGAKMKDGVATATIPARSIVTLEIR